MAKTKKMKVPKKVAGVKVPKKLRRTANQALELAGSPAALEMAAAALGAAAAALAGTKAARNAGRDAADASGAVGQGAVKLGDVVKAAAVEGVRRLLDGVEKPGVAPHLRGSDGASAGMGSAEAQQQAQAKGPRRNGGTAGTGEDRPS